MYSVLFSNNNLVRTGTLLTSRDSYVEVNEVILLKDQLCLEARHLPNWPIKMHRITAKKCLKSISGDFFCKINNDFDITVPSSAEAGVNSLVRFQLDTS